MMDTLSQYWPILLWVVVGTPLVFLASRLASAALVRHKHAHSAMIVRRVIFYTGLVIIITSILVAFEVDLTGLLATAGVATIAIGFAAQASLSNYISGLFLMGERTFHVGDLIQVGGATGIVESIDMLSVKLRTLDNRYVRIPNEEMLKSQATTITRYPIRRMDLLIRVGFKEPLDQVMDILRQVAADNAHCLVEPEPLLLIEEMGEAGFQIRFGVWFEKTRYVVTRNSLFTEVQRQFIEAGIRFQLPRMVVEDYPPVASNDRAVSDK